MNIELLEKASAIREDLLAFKALVPDDAKIIMDEQGKSVPFQNNPHIHKLADLVTQKAPVMQRNYEELRPYMTADQHSRAVLAWAWESTAEIYLRTGKDQLTNVVASKMFSLMLADLDDIAKKLENNAARLRKAEAAT